MQKDIEFYWNLSVAFHGHACPGLAIGCRIAFDAAHLLEVGDRCGDEEGVCIAETDACGIDAVQAIWGCTLGKGNLLLKPRGKQAFTFFKRSSGQGIRFYWVSDPGGEMSREEKTEYFLSAASEELYRAIRADMPLPPEARMSPSLSCTLCGERAAESMVRLFEGKTYCLDCFTGSSRILQ